MEELRKLQKDYGAAFANVLTLAKQRGFDFRTAERLLSALIPDSRATSPEVDHLQSALGKAALAFQQVIEAVHKVGVPALA